MIITTQCHHIIGHEQRDFMGVPCVTAGGDANSQAASLAAERRAGRLTLLALDHGASVAQPLHGTLIVAAVDADLILR